MKLSPAVLLEFNKGWALGVVRLVLVDQSIGTISARAEHFIVDFTQHFSIHHNNMKSGAKNSISIGLSIMIDILAVYCKLNLMHFQIAQ